MKKIISLRNESGLTLIEVLISTVLLIIILSIFLTVFAQSATMNRTSEEIITATYVAQKEMENLYAKSLTSELDDALSSDYEKKLDLIVEGKEWSLFEKVVSEHDYYTRVRTRSMEEYEELTRVIVEIFEGEIKEDESNLQAKMENIFEWRSE